MYKTWGYNLLFGIKLPQWACPNRETWQEITREKGERVLVKLRESERELDIKFLKLEVFTLTLENSVKWACWNQNDDRIWAIGRTNRENENEDYQMYNLQKNIK